MFSTHNINSNYLSIRNLILLFLTIVLGFASVITLANINILSDIENARQTIAKITVTADGTNLGELEMEVSSAGIYINPNILSGAGSFSGRVLGIDDAGNLVYTYSNNLVVSGAGGGGGEHRTGNGTDIRNINPGNVGIGTPAMSGKLHIKGAGTTDVYIEETNAGNAANINLRNTMNTWMIGGYSDRFYLGLNGAAFLNIIPSGYVGIGTTGPKAPLQVIGNFIAGEYSNTISGTNSSIAGGMGNSITGNNSFIGGGNENEIIGNASAIVMGEKNNKIYANDSFIGGGLGNTISGGSYNFVGGGASNEITGNSSRSTIIGGYNNQIKNSLYSFAGGRNAIANTNYTFIWNSVLTPFTSNKAGTFLINVPVDNDMGGVGINIPNPQGELHVGGHGVVVFEPQTTNPQGTGSSCSVLGSVVFSQRVKKLCYCNGANRHTIDDNTLCSF